jgi:hypothetical protein
MLDLHAQKIGFLLSATLAMAGTWFETVQSHLGLAALLLSVLVSVTLVINGLFTICHNLHVHNNDLREERQRLAQEKAALENAVCEERRRTGICPMAKRCNEHDA